MEEILLQVDNDMRKVKEKKSQANSNASTVRAALAKVANTFRLFAPKFKRLKSTLIEGRNQIARQGYKPAEGLDSPLSDKNGEDDKYGPNYGTFS